MIPHPPPLLLDSITDADSAASARVAVSGSHGGLYAAWLASRARLLSVIFNDAGIGLDQAGTGGVLALDGIGMAAAAASHRSCNIGDAVDMLARGVISIANEHARKIGVRNGQPIGEAVQYLFNALPPTGELDAVSESRRILAPDGCNAEVLLADSASLVTDADAARLIVTGSHGGLIGDDPARALKSSSARLAVFNDAGYPAGGAGTMRLPALASRGIPAVTVASRSARIGDAASAWQTGVISCVNEPAAALGASAGDSLAGFVTSVW